MYFILAFIFHLFGTCSGYPYTTEETKGKCCICKKEMKEE